MIFLCSKLVSVSKPDKENGKIFCKKENPRVKKVKNSTIPENRTHGCVPIYRNVVQRLNHSATWADDYVELTVYLYLHVDS